MKIDEYSINYLALLILGENDKDITLRSQSGPNLIKFFNEFGFRDVYSYTDGGLPKKMSRKQYTLDRLKQVNGTKNMEKVILGLLKSSRYLNTKYQVDKIVEELNLIINANDYKLENVNGKYIVIGETMEKEEIEVEPTFEDIQNQIIEEIRKAKYTIWVVVAWFTDNKLFEELKKKADQGVNVQIIVSNEDTNKLKYEQYFEAYRIDRFGLYSNNMMHDKFCVIDLEIVLHGTYNWTNMAQYHKEHIERVKSREIASKYADRFIELKLNN